MHKLKATDLWSLDQYSQRRHAFRQAVMAHKADRRIALGDHVTLYFEDYMTMKYQVMEMLRAERISDPRSIEDELEAYNALIPEGRDWRATMMLEYPDEQQRRTALRELRGIEHRVWVQAGDLDPVYAIADEDMERSTEEKTAAVHFLRFPLSTDAVSALRGGATLALGCDLPVYTCSTVLRDEQRDSLLNDLAS